MSTHADKIISSSSRGEGPAAEQREDKGVASEWFVTPEERKMTLREFFALLRSSRGTGGGEAGGRHPPEVSLRPAWINE